MKASGELKWVLIVSCASGLHRKEALDEEGQDPFAAYLLFS